MEWPKTLWVGCQMLMVVLVARAESGPGTETPVGRTVMLLSPAIR